MILNKKIAIEKIALGIRDILKIKSPVNLKSFVDLLNGCIKYSDQIEHQADARITKKDNDSFEITINYKYKNTDRENFTIAHEIGHLFLHMGYLINENKWNKINEYNDSVYYRYGYTEEEFEANEFAANFLMPKEEFIDIVYKNLNEDNICDFKKVSEYFGVSLKAAITRAKWLGIVRWDIDD